MRISGIEKPKLNIVTTLINQLVAIACGIIIPRIIIGEFGSETYGVTVSITQFLSYITLLESGIGGVARARLYKPLAKKDNREISMIYHAVKSFFGHVAIAFVAYTVILGLLYHDMAHVSIFSRSYVFLLVVIISMATLAKYMGGLANLTLIMADQKQYVTNFIAVGTTIANTVAVIALVNLKCDILWVKLGSSIIFVMRPVLYSVYVRKHYEISKKAKEEKTVLEHKWTGIGQHIAYFLHTNTDVVLLTLFADIRLVAVYSVYNLVISSIRAITASFSGGMEAVFGEMIAKKQIEKLRSEYRRYKTLLVSTSIVLFCCAGILIVPFVRLYTRGIVDADYIQPAFALIMLMAEAINCLTLPCSTLPVAANHLKQTRWGAYGEAAINIVLSCILIQWNPLLGVAIGTLAATTFRGIYYMIYSSKHILNLPRTKLLLNFAVTLAVMLAVMLGGSRLIQLIDIENYYQWVLCGIATFAVTGAPVAAIVFRHMKRI